MRKFTPKRLEISRFQFDFHFFGLRFQNSIEDQKNTDIFLVFDWILDLLLNLMFTEPPHPLEVLLWSFPQGRPAAGCCFPTEVRRPVHYRDGRAGAERDRPPAGLRGCVRQIRQHLTTKLLSVDLLLKFISGAHTISALSKLYLVLLFRYNFLFPGQVWENADFPPIQRRLRKVRPRLRALAIFWRQGEKKRTRSKDTIE